MTQHLIEKKHREKKLMQCNVNKNTPIEISSNRDSIQPRQKKGELVVINTERKKSTYANI